MKLRTEAANEKDPHRFLELIKEINDLLEEKRRIDKGIDKPASSEHGALASGLTVSCPNPLVVPPQSAKTAWL